ncbi:metal-binding protein [Myxosarcina sp. GI1(2024)]
MPSGIVHDRITFWVLPWIGGGTYLLTENGELTLILAAGFLFSSLMFGPDLDIYSLQYRRWGVIRFIWLPYRQLFRHRSLFSHGLVLGTFIRIVYLLLIVGFAAIFIVAISQLIWGFEWNWQQFVLNIFTIIKTKYFSETAAIFAGLELGAINHSLSDWLGSSYKRHHKNKQKLDKNKKLKN